MGCPYPPSRKECSPSFWKLLTMPSGIAWADLASSKVNPEERLSLSAQWRTTLTSHFSSRAHCSTDWGSDSQLGFLLCSFSSLPYTLIPRALPNKHPACQTSSQSLFSVEPNPQEWHLSKCLKEMQASCEPYIYLEEEHSRKRAPPVQRAWGRSMLGVVKKQ